MKALEALGLVGVEIGVLNCPFKVTFIFVTQIKIIGRDICDQVLGQMHLSCCFILRLQRLVICPRNKCGACRNQRGQYYGPSSKVFEDVMFLSYKCKFDFVSKISSFIVIAITHCVILFTPVNNMTTGFYPI